MGLHFIIFAQQADENAFCGRVVEHQVEFGNDIGDGITGVIIESVELMGNGFVDARRQIELYHVITCHNEFGNFGIGEQVFFIDGHGMTSIF